MAIVPTLGRGVLRSGPNGLRGPLARTLGAATAGLAIAAAVPALEARIRAIGASPEAPGPAIAAPGPSAIRERIQDVAAPGSRPAGSVSAPAPAAARAGITVHVTNRITITGRSGETDRDLVDRLLRELDRREARSLREVLGDA